jgi:hypothetical protein
LMEEKWTGATCGRGVGLVVVAVVAAVMVASEVVSWYEIKEGLTFMIH